MRGAVLRPFFAIALLCALPACQQQSASDGGEATDADGSVKGVDRGTKGKLAPATLFDDPAGTDISLAAFRGRPRLVTLWASGCAPCVKELPTLDRLARASSSAGPGGLQVIAISEDSAPPASVVAFLKTHGITSLAAYHDPKMAMSGALGAEVLPTSILFDAQGREIWRYVGDLDWTGGDAAKLLAEAGAARR